MKPNILLLTIVSAILLSCNTKEIEYEAPHFPVNKKVEVKVLNDEYIFRYAHQPYIYDSLLIVADMNEENAVCIFNQYTGNLIAAFGNKGNGPEELVQPTSFSVNHSRGMLYIQDYGKQTIASYNIDNKNGELFTRDNVALVQGLKDKPNIYCLKDSFFIARNVDEGLILATPNRICQKVKVDTPDGSVFKSSKDWAIYMYANGVQNVSSDGKSYVAASTIGGILELFELEDNALRHSFTKHYFKPIFSGVGYQPTPETIYGFCHLSVTEKYIYATVHGKANPTSMPTSIWQFDKKGNPVALFEVGYPIENFVVADNDAIAYATAYGDSGEQVIIEIKI